MRRFANAGRDLPAAVVNAALRRNRRPEVIWLLDGQAAVTRRRGRASSASVRRRVDERLVGPCREWPRAVEWPSRRPLQRLMVRYS